MVCVVAAHDSSLCWKPSPLNPFPLQHMSSEEDGVRAMKSLYKYQLNGKGMSLDASSTDRRPPIVMRKLIT